MTPRLRFLWPVTLITACLVTLCAVTAVSLFTQQAAFAGTLRENVEGRRAATELEECLEDLVALEKQRVESVSALHDRVRDHIETLSRYADQPEEHALFTRLSGGFGEYLRRWREVPPPGHPGHERAVRDATAALEAGVLKPCQEFGVYNGRRIEDSTGHHEKVLRQLAWGIGGVGVLGGLAGLALGYGVAVGLRRSIRRLQVKIIDAADKLSSDVPEVVLTQDGDFRGLQEQVEVLTHRIEEAVLELQRREHEVLRAEQLAAVGQLAAGVAHEIRNPLTSIKMMIQARREEGEAGTLADEDLDIIEQEIRRMERSLQTFIDFARPPKAARRPVDLCDVVRGVTGLVRGRAGKQRVELSEDMPATPITITADRDQLHQVLLNLALNALDAMPAGGRLTIAVRRRTDRRVEIEVADTGPGVGKDLMPKLFQPFASGKDTGLGLGLVISKRIVEDHGGTITAANRVGSGASFYVILDCDS
jgi:signal transduction histidine kinase